MVPVIIAPQEGIPDWALLDAPPWVVCQQDDAHRLLSLGQPAEASPCSPRYLLLPAFCNTTALLTLIALCELEESREQDDPVLVAFSPNQTGPEVSKLLQSLHLAEPWLAEQRLFSRQGVFICQASSWLFRVAKRFPTLLALCQQGLDRARSQDNLCAPELAYQQADTLAVAHTQLLLPGDYAEQGQSLEVPWLQEENTTSKDAPSALWQAS